MATLSGYRDTIRLLRIPFSVFLMPVFLLTLSQATSINIFTALWSFVIIHLLVYPSSNGYNSYIDRDETSIGGLEHPPLPTRQLFYTTILLDTVALLAAAFIVNVLFAFCLLLYIMASRAYSSPQLRFKKYPLGGLLIVVVFQGGFTYYMSYLGITGAALPLTTNNLYILLACTFQIAGAYPLTQVYQHKEDAANGDFTISYRLGYRGTFVFTAVMFALCTLFYYLYFSGRGQVQLFFYLQLFFLPVVIYFLSWFLKVWKDTRQANFKNTMRMNMLASTCTSACFIFFLILKYLL
jgi:1,4-dihydroxy-2-naphthoate octaprenyltransferase